MPHRIGVDTGGTFTDVVVLDDKGATTTGKSLTTYDDFSLGLGGALAIAAEKLSLTTEQLLADTVAFAYGTTIGTNAIATRRGAKVGLLTTAGHRDATHIARGMSRWTGLPESEIKHMAATVKPPPLVPKQLIAEVDERIDADGNVVVPLNRDHVVEGLNSLRRAGVDSIAVCFLWSFRNSAHEDAALELVKELAPELYATCSYQVIALEGEYERFITTVLDAYVGPATRAYMASVARFLADRNLEPRLLLMKADGTTAYADSVMPVATVHSGPAAGVKAAEMLGKLLGYENLIATDVGGTTFDVSVISNGRPSYNREPQIEKYRTLYPTLDIVSLGAGGGTIVRADKELKTIHVGPDSAGSNPGPACYGFGGNEATISDAALLLGYLDPDYFNGGRMQLHRAEAERVFAPVADALGMTLTEAAWGAYEILNAHMSDLITGMTVRRGLNVRDYALLSFGGAGPAHVAYMGATLGAQKAIIPISSSVYSALGLATTPIGHTFVKYDYRVLPITADVLNDNIGPLYRKVREELLAGGAREDTLDISVFIDMQYRLQINAVTMKLPAKEEYTQEDAEALGPLFDQAYTDLYGEGSAYPEAGRAVVSYLVRGEGILHDFSPSPQPFDERGPERALKQSRQAYFKGAGLIDTNIYDFSRLSPGNEVVGPAVIEAEETTIVVPPGFRAALDRYRNVEIATKEGTYAS